MTVIPPGPVIAPVDSATDFSAVGAVKYGWNLFAQNARTWVLATLVAALLTVSVVGMLVVGPFLTRGALLELDGKKPRLGDFFRGINWGPAILVQIVVLAAVMIPVAVGFGLGLGAFSISDNAVVGTLAVVLIGVGVLACIAATFLTYYATFFVIDGKGGVVDSVTASVRVIRKNARPLLILAVLNELIVSAGSAAFCVGLLVAYPVSMIAAVYSYRFVTNGVISADRQMPAPPPPYPVPVSGRQPEPTKVLRAFPPLPPQVD